MKSLKTLSASILIFLLVVGLLAFSVLSQQPAAALHAQVITTSTPEDNSVIGSTDGIVGMGFLIVLIAMIPLLFLRKRK